LKKGLGIAELMGICPPSFFDSHEYFDLGGARKRPVTQDAVSQGLAQRVPAG
jgi:hypothetical protein